MNPVIRPCVAELVGTFYLCFIGAGSICMNEALPAGSKIGFIGIALAHGLALSVAVSATMAVSGGQLNPAVSIALYITKKIDGARAAAFIGSQLLGALLAGLFLRWIFPDQVGGPAFLGTPGIDEPRISPGEAVAIEAVLTFLLLFSIFGTAVDPRAPKIAGFGIGLTVAFDILVGGPLTGAAMNPARHLGIALAAWHLDRSWVYWLGPVLGAAAGALVYDRLILEGPKEKPS
ncbi:MAG: MIP/aquaporin family protein [Thermoanaerobaculia bacterium]